jgi:hypothetical protein
MIEARNIDRTAGAPRRRAIGANLELLVER